jgi:hypothetical protein
LGIEVIQNQRYIFSSQKKYNGELLNKFGMVECNHVSTPMKQNLKLTSKEENEFDDATKYRQLLKVLSILLPIDQTFHFLLGFFPSSCKILVKDISMLQKDF